MRNAGEKEEAIARKLVDMRNSAKLVTRNRMDPREVKKLEKRNKKKYGNPVGPTADSLYQKNSKSPDPWKSVIASTYRTNEEINTELGVEPGTSPSNTPAHGREAPAVAPKSAKLKHSGFLGALTRGFPPRSPFRRRERGAAPQLPPAQGPGASSSREPPSGPEVGRQL